MCSQLNTEFSGLLHERIQHGGGREPLERVEDHGSPGDNKGRMNGVYLRRAAQ